LRTIPVLLLLLSATFSVSPLPLFGIRISQLYASFAALQGLLIPVLCAVRSSFYS
ncbi:hypothetical protein L9F63_009604, partial [Diploptera punctata]